MNFGRFTSVLRDLSVETPPPLAADRPAVEGFEPVWPLGGDREADRLEKLIEAATAKGFAAGRSAAAEHYEEAIRDLTFKSEEKLVEARRTWVAEQGQALAKSVADGLAGTESRLTDAIAGVLVPLVKSGLRRVAVNEVLVGIREAVAIQRNARVALKGPDDLVAEIERQLSSSNIACETTASASAEVEVRVNDLLIMTQLAPLLLRVEDIVR
jgi:hypothetical protein